MKVYFSKTLLYLFLILNFADEGFAKKPASTFGEELQVLQEARKQLFDLQNSEKGYWNFGSNLGPHFMGFYFLSLDWIGRRTLFTKERAEFRELVLKEQLSTGGWTPVHDNNLSDDKKFDINASILIYWYLKSAGESIESPTMKRARSRILKGGGLEASSLFTRIFLALFDGGTWEDVPAIPFLVFKENNLLGITDKKFAQWIGPHIIAIFYLQSLRVSRNLGANYLVDELALNPTSWGSFRHNKSKSRDVVTHGKGRQAIKVQPFDSQKHFKLNRKKYSNWYKEIISRQQPYGSWGGYTISTFLTYISLHDFKSRVAMNAKYFKKFDLSQLENAIEKGTQFCANMSFQSDLEAYLKAISQDGRYWDTGLTGLALIDSASEKNENEKHKLIKAADYLVSIQSENGGFAFGYDFEYAPDVDDTSEIIMFLNHLDQKRYQKPVKRAVDWILSMQNKDGGWGAFDKNNTGGPIVNLMTKDFLDSADIFDESSPDVTGHTLEALGRLGVGKNTDDYVQKAILYLKKSKHKNLGLWSGRWGVNYIYGTSAAIVGALSVGENPSEEYISKALDWFETIQNEDGGFGETTRSYNDETLAGKGMSTPSQTAWAILALMKGNRRGAVLDRAVAYLVKEFQKEGRWRDPSLVGTGHPKVVYMDYASYPRNWPVMALGIYLKIKGADLTKAQVQ